MAPPGAVTGTSTPPRNLLRAGSTTEGPKGDRQHDQDHRPTAADRLSALPHGPAVFGDVAGGAVTGWQDPCGRLAKGRSGGGVRGLGRWWRAPARFRHRTRMGARPFLVAIGRAVLHSPSRRH